ncbi:MAG: flavin reductase domain protein FMN-binding protein [Enterovirga sp.]|nr:flavin reductase domain protein FMN-binding protein [Enterovirga sp.]
MIDPGLFKRGMRRLASGVSLVTTIQDGVPHGFLATSVSSVSAEPRPCLLVCVNRSGSVHDRMQEAGVFCVNLLGETDVALAGRFTAEDRNKRFAGDRWTTLLTGAPAVQGALASFDCEISDAVAIGSHTLFIGSVQALRLQDEDFSPLLYLNGRFEVFRPTGSPAG